MNSPVDADSEYMYIVGDAVGGLGGLEMPPKVICAK